jgi:lipopolysaccharide export system protein LptC
MTRAFRIAARHSRRVRKLRVAIPVTIVFILGATILVSWLDPLKVLVRLPIDSGKLVISGTKITMQAPKLSGYTRDQRWYEMNAKAAAQDVTKPDLVELDEVRAKIETADKTTIYLSSKDGIYNRKSSILNLNHNVIVKSSAGYEMHLDEAVVDTANGEVVSNKPVAVFSQDSTLNSDRLEIQKSGEIVNFIGNVVMNLNNIGKPPDPAATQPTAATR